MSSIQTILDTAQQLYSMDDINLALDKIAQDLVEAYAEDNPLVLCVMNGALMTVGHLLPRLPFPLHLDYIHLSRYGNELEGSEITWLRTPTAEIKSRTVIIIEDIVDQGLTVQAVRDYCQAQGAKNVVCATLVEKLGIEKYGTRPEYVGLTVPNRYVFGFGLDYKGYWRNLPAIYAVNEHSGLES